MQADSSLEDLLTAIAHERDLALAHDTHYDAGNWELRWWHGRARHAIDVQPYPEGRLDVSSVVTSYPLLPRLLAWAGRAVPLFPFQGRVQRKLLGQLQWPCPPTLLRQLLDQGLPPNNSFKPKPLRGSA